MLQMAKTAFTNGSHKAAITKAPPPKSRGGFHPVAAPIPWRQWRLRSRGGFVPVAPSFPRLPDWGPTLHELSNDETDTEVLLTADVSEEFAHDKPEQASGNNSLASQQSDRLIIKYPICRADVTRLLKNQNKRTLSAIVTR